MEEPKRHIKETFKGRSTNRPFDLNLKQAPNGYNYEFFGIVEEGQIVNRFKLYFRNGRILSIPYAFLPIIELNTQGELIITSGDLLIRFHGRALNELEKYLSEERVQWIKESYSGTDSQNEAVFISSIEARGI